VVNRGVLPSLRSVAGFAHLAEPPIMRIFSRMAGEAIVRRSTEDLVLMTSRAIHLRMRTDERKRGQGVIDRSLLPAFGRMACFADSA
jgi:hypothetical protein